MFHKNITLGDNHFLQNWTVSNSAARIALSTTLGSNDIGKVALQQDNSNFYILQASSTGSNFTWFPIGSGGGGGGGVAISAGTNSTSSGTVVFSNSNGVTFGMNTAGVITATVAGAGAAQIGVADDSTAYTDAKSIAFPNVNSNVSFKVTNILANQVDIAATAFINISGGTTSNNLSKFTLSNSNNVSFGMNSTGLITASASFNQTNQTANLIQQVIAGTQTKTSGSLSFADSNGITFGMSGSNTITASHNALTSQSNQAVSAANGSSTFQTLSFANSNGLSFGTAAGGLTASYTVPSTAGLLSAVNISGGTTSNNLSAFVFSNSNNVSFGLNGSTLTATATFNQSVQTQNSVQVLGSTGNISFGNANGVTFGGNASTITASVAAQTVQTQNLHNVVLSGNTAGVMATVSSGTMTIAGGNNITVSQVGNAFTISGPNVGGAQTGISAIIAGTQTQTVGTVSFANSNGISFGMSNSSVITASHNGITTGRASTDGVGLNTAQSNVTWTVNSAGISLDARGYAGTGTSATNASITLNSNGLAISIASPTGNFTAGVSTQGNTSGNTGTVSNQLIFVGGNNITLSQSTNAGGATITVSGANVGGAQTGVSGISAGTTQMTSGTAVFSNSNGISFGVNGNTVTASYTVPGATVFSNSNNVSFGLNGSTVTATASFNQTAQTQNIVVPSAGTQTATSGTVVFANSNGISFGMSNSNQITASYTVPSTAGLLSAINVSAGTTSNNLSAFVASNSNNVSFGLNGSTLTASASFNQTVQPGIQSVIVSNTTYTTGQVSFSNANGITFGSSAGGGVITASHNALTTAAQSNHSHGNPTLNLTNLSGTTASNSAGFTLSLSALSQSVQPVAASGSNGSFAFSTLSFGSSNGLHFYTTNGSIVGSYTVGGGGSPNFSAGTTSNNLGSLVFSNSNGVSFGLNGSTITASVGAGGGGAFSAGISTQGNTAGTTGFVGSQIQFVGTNGISLSQSVNGASASLTIVGPASSSLVGGNNITLSTNGSTVSIIGPSNTLSFWEPNAPVGTSLSSMGQNSLHFFPVQVPTNLSMTGFLVSLSLNNATSSVSHSKGLTMSYGLYFPGTGANSTRIESSATSSLAFLASYSSNLSGGYTISQGTNSTTFSSAGIGSTSAWTGQRLLELPFATFLSAGALPIFCFANSTTQTNAASALMISNVVLNTQTNASYGRLRANGNTVSNNSIIASNAGFIYTATSGAWPSTIALSQRSVYSNIRMMLQMGM